MAASQNWPAPHLLCFYHRQRSVSLCQRQVATPRNLRNPRTGLENEDQSKNAILNLVRSGLLCHLASGPHFLQLPFQHWCLCRSLFHCPSISGLLKESQTHWTPNILSCVANGKIKKPLLQLEDFTAVSFPQIPVLYCLYQTHYFKSSSAENCVLILHNHCL